MQNAKTLARRNPTSYQLPVRFDKASDDALKSLVERLSKKGPVTASEVVRWAVLHFDREVGDNVDRNGVPINGDPPGLKKESPPNPLSAPAKSAQGGSR